MKTCPKCRKNYSDEDLNFCLDDGETLMRLFDDAPPTVVLEPPRITNETNWQNAPPISNRQNRLGIGALITGYLGLNNFNNNPVRYGGKGLAVAGLILGAISVFSSVIFIIFVIMGSLK